MGDNSYTRTFQDGTALTQSQLDTGFKSVKLDISNTTSMTSGSTSGEFLRSNGDGLAASFESVPDPLGPFALRNYGLAAVASASALVIRLKSQAGTDPTSTDVVNLTFSNNGTTTGTYSAVNVTGALSISVTASATLSFGSTAANKVYVYAINSGGTAKLAVSARSDFDRGEAITTTAMGATADSGNLLYATAALTVVPRLLGYIEAALNSSKQWQTPTRTVVTQSAPYAVETNRLTLGTTTTSSSTTVGQIVISGSSGSYSASSASFVDVTNLTVVMSTSGRPVKLMLIPASSTSTCFVGPRTTSDTDAQMDLQFLRGTSSLGIHTIAVSPASTGTIELFLPPSAFQALDVVAAGRYTYKVQVRRSSGSGANDTFQVTRCKLLAYEI